MALFPDNNSTVDNETNGGGLVHFRITKIIIANKTLVSILLKVLLEATVTPDAELKPTRTGSDMKSKRTPKKLQKKKVFGNM